MMYASPGPSRPPLVAQASSTGINSASYIRLVHLIIQGDIENLTVFLTTNRSQVDVQDENGQTALMFACQQGEVAFVQRLIHLGADVNAADHDNWTPLLNAAKEGHSSVVVELLNSHAALELRDAGNWTALMWACYKGHLDVVQLLLKNGADPNAVGNYHVSGLMWAAGRGYTDIVRELLNYVAKVNMGDKYGTTALIWASRKGYFDIAELLLKSGAAPDACGMYCWTPLLVATKGNYADIVSLLLEYHPNVNITDSEGASALTIACKEGFTEIAESLLKAGAYVNLQDRAGDTNLIHASKGGHLEIVEALLKKYADVDIQGTDRKMAIYWAIEKGHVNVVKSILAVDPDLELTTKDGDTPLLKATRNRNADIVQLLLEKKAKVSAADKKGDTALHIAMRSRCRALVELLLRNPKHSQLLYRPNRNGETPYNIDASQHKSILAQIFGARRLNTNEDNENLLGYDLYSSALADILSEPSLSMPICVGLYAKWGSGKSFLLGKLQDEMKNFAKQWVEPTFVFNWISFLVVLTISVIVGALIGFAFNQWYIRIIIGATIFVLSHIFLGIIRFGCEHFWKYTYEISVYLARKLTSLRLFLQVIFCHPPQLNTASDGPHSLAIKFLFTDYTKVSSTGGDANVADMVASLYQALEREYGVMTTRLYTVFRPKPVNTSSWRWRCVCCIPHFVIAVFLLICIIGVIVLLGVINFDLTGAEYYKDPLVSAPAASSSFPYSEKQKYENTLQDEDDDVEEKKTPILKKNLLNIKKGLSKENYFIARGFLIAALCILCLSLIINIRTIVKICIAIVYPPKRSVANLTLGSEAPASGSSKARGHLQPIRASVQLMTDMVKCLDGFSGNKTRLVVVVDGLDSCQQDKVLHNLDAVHLLFSDPGGPFITLLAIDPHVVVKAIELNIHRVFRDSSISGNDYLRNIVHLPFYLQNSGLRRVRVAQRAALLQRKSGLISEENVGIRRLSAESSMSIPDRLKQARQKGSKKLNNSESVASSLGNLHKVTGAQDLTKVLLTDDYFSDVNPRSMRRLMNVMYVTGRLLKAFDIDFNWYHLASWVNITEQWPYHTSWIILYFEKHEESLEDGLSLKSIYDRLSDQIPSSKDIEPLLEIDRDERKFDIFLSFHKASLHVSDIKVFLPFTINLDPHIRKVIREEQQNIDDLVRFDAPMTLITRPTPTTDSRLIHRKQSKVNPPPSPWIYPYPSPMIIPQPTPSAPPAAWPTPYPMPTARRPRSQDTASRALHMQVIPERDNEQSPNLSVVKYHLDVGPNHRLSELSVDGVCRMLNSITGLSGTKIELYKKTIEDHNIHGSVLLYCNLDELKEVMQMTFGDWELWRMTILGLRDRELNPEREDDFDDLHSNLPVVTSSSSSSRLGSMSESRGVQRESNQKSSFEPKLYRNRELTESDGSNRGSQRDRDRERVSPKRQNQRTFEKQVTLEEQMIVGALHALNEQASEDALESRNQISIVSSGTANSILSPILSDPDENDQGNLETDVQLHHLIDSLGPVSATTPHSLRQASSLWNSMTSADAEETDILYIKSTPASPLAQMGSSIEEGLGSPRQSKNIMLQRPQHDTHMVVRSENEHNEDKHTVSSVNVVVPEYVSGSGSRKSRSMHRTSPLSSPNDSDTENSESAPLVFRPLRQGSKRWGYPTGRPGDVVHGESPLGHSNATDVTGHEEHLVGMESPLSDLNALEMTFRSSERGRPLPPPPPSLNIDAVEFRAVGTVTSPSLSKATSQTTQTSPQKGLSSQYMKPTDDLLGMLGGNETVL